MTNVAPFPRAGRPALADAPFDMEVTTPPPDRPDDDDRRGGGGGAGGDGAAREPDCPVTPLGHRDGVHFFFDPAGQERALAASALGQRASLDVLFCGKLDWCTTVAPARDKEGEIIPGDYGVKAIARRLISMNAHAGLFRTDTPRRGPGVWISPAGVRHLHLGDVVVVLADGKPQERRAGFLADGALWPAHPALLPARGRGTKRLAWLEHHASAEEAATVEAVFARWNWGTAPQEGIFFGLWAAHLLGAAIRWRPHGLVVGPPGSGKTTLMEAYAALSPLAVLLNDFTEAGLRQMLSGRAQPLLLDEAEGDADGVARLQRVIELLRRASGGSGAQTVRGSSGGQSQRFEVMSPALLGAVLPPVLLPQDASRITRLDLAPRKDGGQPLPSPAEIAALRELAPRLWGRALAGLPRMAANLVVLRQALLGRGCAPRLADQVGTILAARAMMLRDEELDAAQADEDVSAFGWLAPSEAEQAPDAGPAACLTHLLQSPLEVTANGERPSVGETILRAYAEQGERERRWLAEHGLLLAPWPRKGGGDQWLYVADKHPRLGRLFDGTAWASGRWKEDLRRLPGAVIPEQPQWIGQAKPRCTVLPPAVLPDSEGRAPVSLTFLRNLAGEHGLGDSWVLRAVEQRWTQAQAQADATRPPRPG